MYYTAGIWLIYAGVVLRVFERYTGLPQRGLVMLLFALYGLLLFVEPWIVERKTLPLFLGNRISSEDPGLPQGQPEERAGNRRWLAATYLFVQSALVVTLFSIPPHVDFFAGLFIPLSLQAVLFFGRRLGFLCIALFPVAMFVPLTTNEKGWTFALVMSIFLGGLCFLFGSYAHQVQKAEKARTQNQRMLAELQHAHQQLQGYAQQAEHLAAEQERSRLARELHDSVTQTVFSMNLTVQSARLLLEKDPGRAAGQLVRLEELASSAMGEIQTLVSQLRPPSMAEVGLVVALRRLAVERQLRDGLQVALEMDGERTLGEAAAAGLYRIAQEGLTNVAKHAGTCEVTIRLNLGGDLACLEIEDRGLGFDPQAAFSQQGHLGLAGMAERAREIGWDLAIDSRPGLGTRIRVEESPLGGRR
jgi:signal transduction histidine kinase